MPWHGRSPPPMGGSGGVGHLSCQWQGLLVSQLSSLSGDGNSHMDVISQQQGKWSVQKRLLANGVLVSNGRFKGPVDGHAELPGRHRAALDGIRLGARASSLAQGRRWETAHLSAGRPLAKSGEQKPRTGRDGGGRRKP